MTQLALEIFLGYYKTQQKCVDTGNTYWQRQDI